MRFPNIILLAVFALASVKASAQLHFQSLEEVWAYADAHNIQLQAAIVGKANAGIQVKQSYGAVLPSVTANGAYTDNMTIQPTLVPANLFNPNAPANTYTEATFGRRYIYNGTIAAQLDILNVQDWFNIKTAKLNSEIASLNIAQTQVALYEQLAGSYYTYILSGEVERLSRANLQASVTTFSLAKNKYEEGLISEVTVNSAQINKEKAEKALEVAQQNKLMQLNTLRGLLNTPDSISLPGEMEYPDIALHTGFAPDPAVALSGLQVQASKTQWQASKGTFMPTLSAVYQYNTQIAGDNFLSYDNTNNLPQQYWGLRLSVPLFSGGARKYEVQKSKLLYNQKQKEFENAKLQSAINNENLLIAYNNSLKSYQKSKEILALYQSNDGHAEKKLTEGIISLDERLKVYSDMIANQNEYLQSMGDYLVQQYRLSIRQTNFTK